MTVLTAKDPDRTYQGILNVGNPVNSNSQQITDGLGNEIGISVSTTGVNIYNDLTVGNITISGSGIPYVGFVSVKSFGAVGDGITDDTIALNAAISGATHLYFPAGTYIVSAQLTITNRQRILVGDGIGKTILSYSSTNTACIETTSTSLFMVKDMTIQGPHSGSTYLANSEGVRIRGDSYASGASNITFENVEIKNFGENGVYMRFAQNIRFKNCKVTRIGRAGFLILSSDKGWIEDCYIGNITPGNGGSAPYLNAYGVIITRTTSNVNIDTDPTSTSWWVQNNYVTDIPSWEGLDTHGGVDIHFINNKIYNCATALNITHADSTGSGTSDVNAEKISLIGNTCKYDPSATINVKQAITLTPKGGSATVPSCYIVQGNYIEGHGTHDFAIDDHGALFVANVRDCVIDGNVFINSYYSGIQFNSVCTNVAISNNTFSVVNTINSVQCAIWVATTTFSGSATANQFYGAMDAFGGSAPGAGYSGLNLGTTNVIDSSVTNTFLGTNVTNFPESRFRDVKGVIIPVGTTAQRDSTPEEGTLRNNTTTGLLEVYIGGGWVNYIKVGDGNAMGNNSVSGTTITIADDAAASFTPTNPIGTIVISPRSSGYPTIAALAAYRCTATAFVQIIAQPSTTIESTTGVLAGTTGTDTKVTISAHTDNKIYIENRSGGSISIHYVCGGA